MASPDTTHLTPPVSPELRPIATSDRTVLIWGYTLGVLIPIIGWAIAIHIAVGQSRAKIRRHAIGVGALALTTFGIYLAIILSLGGPRSDSAVTSDLGTLLTGNGIAYQSIQCTHQSGNQYACLVTTTGTGGPIGVQVTDDGHSIEEQGISAP